jgi:hypothetical protein
MINDSVCGIFVARFQFLFLVGVCLIQEFIFCDGSSRLVTYSACKSRPHRRVSPASLKALPFVYR